ncbi:hypothetical protein K501DRAFT_273572 [Backusella circina FSU 941]|nr:hypothetical protein K501DRAFT_273572 [Backusella circina FSU 941]
MVELKEKKKVKDDDRFKPVPNPNYKPTAHKNSIATIVDPLQNIIPTERDNIYQNNRTYSSIPSYNSKTSQGNKANPEIPRSITPKVSMEPVVQSIRVEEPNSINAQVVKPKVTNTQPEIPKVNNLKTGPFKYTNSQLNKPIAEVKTPRPSSTFRISPLYAMTPQAATTTISRRSSTLTRQSNMENPPPLPSTPRPNTASLILDSENGVEKRRMEERWTISSSRKLEKLPVRVSNPKVNHRNSYQFSSKPLPAPPKHTEYRTSSGFENLECTTNFYQPSLTKQPSWISDQSVKLNQSQQNERALELTQNK